MKKKSTVSQQTWLKVALRTWYIAGNRITGEGLAPLCEVLRGPGCALLWVKLDRLPRSIPGRSLWNQDRDYSRLQDWTELGKSCYHKRKIWFGIDRFSLASLTFFCFCSSMVAMPPALIVIIEKAPTPHHHFQRSRRWSICPSALVEAKSAACRWGRPG